MTVSGTGALTVNTNVAVADPPVFVAVTVNVAALAFVVGVPLNAPEDVLKVIPAGAEGEIE
jgi:hypothetical protein